MLQRVIIHRFSFRQNLVLGGDRELVMFAGLMAFAMIFSAQTVAATIYGITLWVVSLFLLRLMAKSDPNMRHVYMRHIKYKKYYPPRSTPFRIG